MRSESVTKHYLQSYNVYMTRNPFLNALAAFLYIALVASLMFYGQRIVAPVEDWVIMPIAMISLFTLSAAMMGYIFLSKPFELYSDNKKSEAMNLFVKTLLTFAFITVIIFIILLSVRL